VKSSPLVAAPAAAGAPGGPALGAPGVAPFAGRAVGPVGALPTPVAGPCPAGPRDWLPTSPTQPASNKDNHRSTRGGDIELVCDSAVRKIPCARPSDGDRSETKRDDAILASEASPGIEEHFAATAPDFGPNHCRILPAADVITTWRMA
jgi:hypothetical protein